MNIDRLPPIAEDLLRRKPFLTLWLLVAALYGLVVAPTLILIRIF